MLMRTLKKVTQVKVVTNCAKKLIRGREAGAGSKRVVEITEGVKHLSSPDTTVYLFTTHNLYGHSTCTLRQTVLITFNQLSRMSIHLVTYTATKMKYRCKLVRPEEASCFLKVKST